MSRRGAMRIEIAGGGVPGPAALAALTAAVAALLQEDTAGAPMADPRTVAYRSRWRHAAMREMTDVPARIKDNGISWGGTA